MGNVVFFPSSSAVELISTADYGRQLKIKFRKHSVHEGRLMPIASVSHLDFEHFQSGIGSDDDELFRLSLILSGGERFLLHESDKEEEVRELLSSICKEFDLPLNAEPDSAFLTQCPSCGRTVYVSARKCNYCGAAWSAKC